MHIPASIYTNLSSTKNKRSIRFAEYLDHNMKIVPVQHPNSINYALYSSNVLPVRQSPPTGLKCTTLHTIDVSEERRRRALGTVYIPFIYFIIF